MPNPPPFAMPHDNDIPATEIDRQHMRVALALAARGLGNTWPNPAVGCVIVRDGVVVGRGWTSPGGRPHAEVNALTRAGEAARGATAYVTLEPCSHWGKTPPCVDALARAGVARVVSALRDPDPRVDGNGIRRLRESGIAVTEGVLEAEARALNAGFIRRIETGLPLVTLKLATTLDGRIATRTRESRWITGPEARRLTHALRGTHDAILVGSGTVLADDPDLSCRLEGFTPRPILRAVADTRLRTPPTARLLQGGPEAVHARGEVVVLTVAGHDRAAMDRLSGAGATLVVVPPSGRPATDPSGARDSDRLDPEAILRALAARGVTRLMVEGGATLAASLLRAGLVDRLAWFHAPGIMGGDGLPAAQALPVDSLAAIPKFLRTATIPCGPDLLSEFERA
ncbi:5-amino-6-(5-phosphoribosylamino)uracil reductase [Roseomonas mucosa]|uniref:Riboflavin biosynthesis protein RibD n=2 Tax=Roseomonadaceae TaxID=3385906 RepID=A0A379N3A1_9PROT|nr:5-amino-6-(5-phosphoribosylamino)uracil reductase [Roseomonas mucosa]UZO92663.1 5-amino-6-(5-phosphoribosylamino)uracil reductase [Roseomonas mucosa]SUE41588.1 Riboflavin biosynthesis protein RibD [Roseomonas mucosa]